MTDRICYLHVGTGKTGSSAIQFALTKMRDELLARGYSYPDASQNFDRVLAGKPTAGNGLRMDLALREQNPEAAVAILKKYASDSRHLIVSCEGFSGQSAPSLQGFATGIRNLGFEPKCLVFFRPQTELVISSYLQQVKANKVQVDIGLDRYAEHYFNRKRIRQAGNWYARAEKLSKIFGRPNVTVNWYPALKKGAPNAVVATTFDWLGLPGLLQSRPENAAELMINPTPGEEALIVLRLANENGLGGRSFADEFLDRASGENILGTKIALHPATLERLHADTLPSNRRLLEEYCPELSANIELALPSAGSVSQPNAEILARLKALASDVLRRQHKSRRVRKKIRTLFGTTSQPQATGPITTVAIPSNGRAGPGSKPPGRCIIHIGMHKTGSTSIQESLCGFEDGRILYADLAAHGNHSLPIYSLFSDQPERHHLHQNAGRDQQAIRLYNESIRERLDGAASALGDRTLVISGEDIAVLARADLVKMRGYLETRFGETKIVAYVRAPAGYITSSFQQKIKGGRVNSFDLADMYRNYRASFEKFDAVFGRDRVHLWKFDPSTFPEGDVVRDFCSRLGISFRNKKIMRLNESLSRQAVAALYTYNKFADQNGAGRLKGRDGMKLGKLLDGDKFRLSPDALRPVLEANRSDIGWMEARLGTSLTEDLGEPSSTDIREETDLLGPDPELVRKLMRHLRRSVPAGVTGDKPEDVAFLVEHLYKSQRLFGASGFLSKIYRRKRPRERVK